MVTVRYEYDAALAKSIISKSLKMRLKLLGRNIKADDVNLRDRHLVLNKHITTRGGILSLITNTSPNGSYHSEICVLNLKSDLFMKS